MIVNFFCDVKKTKYLPIHLSIISLPVTKGAMLTIFLPFATVKIDSPSCVKPMLFSIDMQGAYLATYAKEKITHS
jgi:hypothetical protein